MGGSTLNSIILIILLILINAFFAASEIAVISTRKARIDELEEKGVKSAKALNRLIKDPSLFLATIQVGITLAGFLASATAAVGISNIIADRLTAVGVPVGYARALGVVTVTLIISYFTLIFGELTPKRLAMQWSEKISLLVARPIYFMAVATSPVTKFLQFSTNVVFRALGGDPNQNTTEVTEDEIRSYIAEHRTLPVEEKRMIEGVFDFGDQIVRQVMVPRTQIAYLNVNDGIEEIRQELNYSTFDVFPVYRDDFDDIVGVVYIYDLMKVILNNNKRVKIEEVMSPAYFIPETKPTVDLLKEFHERRIKMAIVVDEFGGTVGLVTLRDLMDEIIDEIDGEKVSISEISQDQWLVEGDTPIEDVVEQVNLRGFSNDTDYDTIAGFILKKLGYLPQKGEAVFWDDYKFQVEEVGENRIKRILISLRVDE